MNAVNAPATAAVKVAETIEVPTFRPGAGLAALMGAALGMMSLAIVNFATEANAGFLDWVFTVGKSWVPDGNAIGPYSGLETFMLLGWFGSWFGLHLAWRNRTRLNVRLWVTLALVLMIVAVLFLWPPIIDGLLGK